MKKLILGIMLVFSLLFVVSPILSIVFAKQKAAPCNLYTGPNWDCNSTGGNCCGVVVVNG